MTYGIFIFDKTKGLGLGNSPKLSCGRKKEKKEKKKRAASSPKGRSVRPPLMRRSNIPARIPTPSLNGAQSLQRILQRRSLGPDQSGQPARASVRAGGVEKLPGMQAGYDMHRTVLVLGEKIIVVLRQVVRRRRGEERVEFGRDDGDDNFGGGGRGEVGDGVLQADKLVMGGWV